MATIPTIPRPAAAASSPPYVTPASSAVPSGLPRPCLTSNSAAELTSNSPIDTAGTNSAPHTAGNEDDLNSDDGADSDNSDTDPNNHDQSSVPVPVAVAAPVAPPVSPKPVTFHNTHTILHGIISCCVQRFWKSNSTPTETHAFVSTMFMRSGSSLALSQVVLLYLCRFYKARFTPPSHFSEIAKQSPSANCSRRMFSAALMLAYKYVASNDTTISWPSIFKIPEEQLLEYQDVFLDIIFWDTNCNNLKIWSTLTLNCVYKGTIDYDSMLRIAVIDSEFIT